MTRLSKGESRVTRGVLVRKRPAASRSTGSAYTVPAKPSTARATISAATDHLRQCRGNDIPVADADVIADLLFAGHAQGGEGASDDEPSQFIRFGWPGVDSGRQDAFGQVINAFETTPFADHQLAAPEQQFQRRLRRLPIPPVPLPGQTNRIRQDRRMIGAVPPGSLPLQGQTNRISKIAGCQRPFGSDRRRHRCERVLLAPAPVPRPLDRVVGSRASWAGRSGSRPWAGTRPRAPSTRKRLRSTAVRLVQVLRPVARHPGPQRMVMGALDHRNSVDLHVTQVIDGFSHSAFACPHRRSSVQQLGIQQQAPRRLLRNRIGAHRNILTERRR